VIVENGESDGMLGGGVDQRHLARARWRSSGTGVGG
jgi:hypothetical protein